MSLSASRQDQQRFARRLLLIQYAARLPPRSQRFRWLDPQSLLAIQSTIYSDLLSHPRTDVYTPFDASSSIRLYSATNEYEKAFLRELVARLQDAVDIESAALKDRGDVEQTEYPEVDADLLERYVELMAYGSANGAGPATGDGASWMMPPECEHVTYLWQATSSSPRSANIVTPASDLPHDYAAVTIREEGSAISKGTTGLKTWEACLRLANYLLVHPDLILAPGSRVLELGSGAGLLGAVCATEQTLANARCEAGSSQERRQTWLTDMPGPVLERLDETLRLNGLDTSQSAAHLHALDWVDLQALARSTSSSMAYDKEDNDVPCDEDRPDLLGFLRKVKPTLVLAADVVYDPDLVGPLACTVRAALQAARDGGGSDAKALISSTIRNPTTYKSFRDALDNECLEIEAIPIRQKYMHPPPDGDGFEGLAVEPLPFFPSVHDPVCDGTVELLQIRLGAP